MNKFVAAIAGVVVALAMATPAMADDSADSTRATAIVACNAHPGAKNVTVTVKIAGRTTRTSYSCSELLAQTRLPTPNEFKVGIDVVAKQCFASAGCSVAYKINPKYTGAAPLDPSKVYTVVYDVEGAEQPITSNFTIKGNKIRSQKGTAYLTNKSNALTAKVTSVLEGDQS